MIVRTSILHGSLAAAPAVVVFRAKMWTACATHDVGLCNEPCRHIFKMWLVENLDIGIHIQMLWTAARIATPLRDGR